MKIFRHISYVLLLLLTLTSLTFLFNTNVGAGYVFSGANLLILVLYATDFGVWKSIPKKKSKPKKISTVHREDYDDEDAQYR